VFVVFQARAYLLSAGFSLAFGSMFTKTYRVHRIFTRSRSGVVKNKVSLFSQSLFSAEHVHQRGKPYDLAMHGNKKNVYKFKNKQFPALRETQNVSEYRVSGETWGKLYQRRSCGSMSGLVRMNKLRDIALS